MEIISTISALDARLASESGIVLVPTMGNLHAGHLELARLARSHGECVVVSIFVNPLQFGPNEDFLKYSRTLTEDCAKLEQLGVDVMFTPGVNELFPGTQQTQVEPPPIAGDLCGAFRPGHFRGVATIVLKLFNAVQPYAAVFGKKDYQQLHIVRAMVRDLNVPVRIVAGETVRAEDGLALSSRNAYLSEAERAEAVRLYQNLQRMGVAVAGGVHNFAALEAVAKADLEAHGWRVEYVSVRDAATLEAPGAASQRFIILGAAWLGHTRLIDNIEAVCLELHQAL